MPWTGELSAKTRALAIIPARFASTRFPGKPLADIDGVPMVVRVARQVERATRIERVIVATDDERIARAVCSAGFEAAMTDIACASGTDRVAEVIARDGVADGVDLVVNVQGDEPLIDPSDIDLLVAGTLAAGAPMGTLARRLGSMADFVNPNVVKVVIDHLGRALYFSRAPIPAGADPAASDIERRPLQHAGIYAYRPEALRTLATLAPTNLERCERLEQLRALEYGISIAVTLSASEQPSIAVDVPEDIQKVRVYL